MGIIHMRILNGKKEEKKLLEINFFLFLQSKPYYYSRSFL